jgi:hypothetical protein
MCPKQSSRISDLPASPFLNNMKLTKKAAVTETKVVEIEPAKIIIELSVIEARALGAVMGTASDSKFRVACETDYHFKMDSQYVPRGFNHQFYNLIVNAVSNLHGKIH